MEKIKIQRRLVISTPRQQWWTSSRDLHILKNLKVGYTLVGIVTWQTKWLKVRKKNTIHSVAINRQYWHLGVVVETTHLKEPHRFPIQGLTVASIRQTTLDRTNVTIKQFYENQLQLCLRTDGLPAVIDSGPARPMGGNCSDYPLDFVKIVAGQKVGEGQGGECSENLVVSY
jgi:hypothetical protein